MLSHSIKVRSAELRLLDLRTRLPFRYGITTMTEVPHLFLRIHLKIGSKTSVGIAADGYCHCAAVRTGAPLRSTKGSENPLRAGNWPGSGNGSEA